MCINREIPFKINNHHSYKRRIILLKAQMVHNLIKICVEAINGMRFEDITHEAEFTKNAICN